MSSRAAIALASGLGLTAMTATYLTLPWEGMETTAYYDRLGRVWTVCAGETKGVKKGDSYTRQQCLQKLVVALETRYRKPLRKCIRGFDNYPMGVQAAMLDAAYNVGVAAICRSTAVRLAMAGRFRESCHALTAFNRAGGRKIRGLVLRREYGDATRMGELELCLTSVRQGAGT